MDEIVMEMALTCLWLVGNAVALVIGVLVLGIIPDR